MPRTPVALLAVLALVGCGGDGEPSPSGEREPDARTQAALADVRRLCSPFLDGEEERACEILREVLADGRVADAEVDAVADAVATLEAAGTG